jgi:peptidase E
MTTVSYEMASAPQMLTKLQQKLEDKIQFFPVASQLTNKNFYSTNQTDAVK